MREFRCELFGRTFLEFVFLLRTEYEPSGTRGTRSPYVNMGAQNSNYWGWAVAISEQLKLVDGQLDYAETANYEYAYLVG